MNNFDGFGKEFEQLRSRRGFLSWLKRVAGGASLAVIGLSIADPKNVFADPNCTPCSGCDMISCTYEKNHCGATYPWLFYYKFYTGCVPPGCTTNYNSCCVYECSCSPCNDNNCCHYPPQALQKAVLRS
jgi:hypothetical protein